MIYILIPFYTDPQISTFFGKLMKATDADFKMELGCKLLDKKNAGERQYLEQLFSKMKKHRLDCYDELVKIKRTDKFPVANKKQIDFARSLLYKGKYTTKTDSIVFLFRKEAKVKNNSGYIYYFKRKHFKNDKWYLDYVGLQPLDTNKVSTDKDLLARNILLSEDLPASTESAKKSDPAPVKEADLTKKIDKAVKQSMLNTRLMWRQRASKDKD